MSYFYGNSRLSCGFTLFMQGIDSFGCTGKINVDDFIGLFAGGHIEILEIYLPKKGQALY